jgi:hypothetical protein
VCLVAFHENEAIIAAQTLEELEAIRLGIINGDIEIP